jgi:hypothetical protein
MKNVENENECFNEDYISVPRSLCPFLIFNKIMATANTTGTATIIPII